MKDFVAGSLADETATAPARELQDMLRTPFKASAPADAARIEGAVIGVLVGFTDCGATPLVTIPGRRTSAALPARSTVDLHAVHVGRQAVVMFEDGELTRPIIIGCLEEAGARTPLNTQGGVDVEADVDGKRLLVTAKEEIVLRCGKASITLTKDGKVLVQGTYVSSCSSGAHRIRGGSVQIN